MAHLGEYNAILQCLASFLNLLGGGNIIILISMVKSEMRIALTSEQVIRQGKVGCCSTALQRSAARW